MQALSPSDVAGMTKMHGGFADVPAELQAALCGKLVNGLLDSALSFELVVGGGGAGGGSSTRARIPLAAGEDVWLCEHLGSFDSVEQLQAIAAAASPALRGMVAGANGTLGGASTDALAASLLASHSHLLETSAAPNATTHYILDDWADGMAAGCGSAGDHAAASCSRSTFFSPLHGRHYTAVWTTQPHAAGQTCTLGGGLPAAYLPGATGGNAHMRRLLAGNDRFRRLFCLSHPEAAGAARLPSTAADSAAAVAEAAAASAVEPAGITNLSPDPARPLLMWQNFLTEDEVEYLRGIVYSPGEDSGGATGCNFGTQFVSAGKVRAGPRPSSSSSSSEDGGGGGGGDAGEATTTSAKAAAATCGSGGGTGNGSDDSDGVPELSAATKALLAEVMGGGDSDSSTDDDDDDAKQRRKQPTVLPPGPRINTPAWVFV